MFKRYVFSEGLTNLIGSNGEYLINVLGQVKNKQGNDLPVTRDEYGNQLVHCHGWEGVRDYRVIDLVAIQYKNIQIPVELYSRVEAFVADNDPDHTHAVNVGYRFKGGPLEVSDHPGFYYVPGFTRIGINKEGVALELKTKCYKKYYVSKPDTKRNSKGGYRIMTGIYFCPKVYTGSYRHRMLCLVFKPYPNNVDALTVNHKDGIPGNDWLDNLEWATHSENVRHSYENDLHTKNKRVLVRDVRTGEITEYRSVKECAKMLGYSAHEIIRGRLLDSEFCNVFADGKQFKLKDDSRDWIVPIDAVKAIAEARQNLPTLVRNCITLEVKSYPSQIEAAKATEVKREAIKDRLLRDNMKPLFGYQFKLESDLRPWLYFTQEDYHLSLNGYNYLVSARNLLTGETEEFSSVNKASQYFNNRSLYKKLIVGKQVLLESGWQIKFSHHEWEDVPDFEEAIYKLTRDVTARHEGTGECCIASSFQQLANHLNLPAVMIEKAALTRGNQLYSGYRFRLGSSSEPWPETTTAT